MDVNILAYRLIFFVLEKKRKKGKYMNEHLLQLL